VSTPLRVCLFGLVLACVCVCVLGGARGRACPSALFYFLYDFVILVSLVIGFVFCHHTGVIIVIITISLLHVQCSSLSDFPFFPLHSPPSDLCGMIMTMMAMLFPFRASVPLWCVCVSCFPLVVLMSVAFSCFRFTSYPRRASPSFSSYLLSIIVSMSLFMSEASLTELVPFSSLVFPPPPLFFFYSCAVVQLLFS
jgi:hypothetical protein